MNKSADQRRVLPPFTTEIEYFGFSYFTTVHSFCADIKSTCDELSVRPGALLYCMSTDWFARDSEFPKSLCLMYSEVNLQENCCT